MKMHVLAGGRLRVRKGIYIPNVDRSETIELPISAFLIRHPQGNVLFDSGYHPSVAENAGVRWGGMAKSMTPIGLPDENVVDSLRCIGFNPEDIDVVVCSHLHPDHCGCTGFFTKATMVCHAKEVAAARAPDSAKMGYFRDDWDQIPIQEIDGQHDLFGDERIVLVPVPGHTPGTIAALVNLDRSGQFLLASDAVSLRFSLDENVMPRNTWNVDQAWASFAEIKRIENGGATVICGHDDVQWQSLKKGLDTYE